MPYDFVCNEEQGRGVLFRGALYQAEIDNNTVFLTKYKLGEVELGERVQGTPLEKSLHESIRKGTEMRLPMPDLPATEQKWEKDGVLFMQYGVDGIRVTIHDGHGYVIRPDGTEVTIDAVEHYIEGATLGEVEEIQPTRLEAAVVRALKRKEKHIRMPFCVLDHNI